jgi:hypothetical protein
MALELTMLNVDIANVPKDIGHGSTRLSNIMFYIIHAFPLPEIPPVPYPFILIRSPLVTNPA